MHNNSFYALIIRDLFLHLTILYSYYLFTLGTIVTNLAIFPLGIMVTNLTIFPLGSVVTNLTIFPLGIMVTNLTIFPLGSIVTNLTIFEWEHTETCAPANWIQTSQNGSTPVVHTYVQPILQLLGWFWLVLVINL